MTRTVAPTVEQRAAIVSEVNDIAMQDDPSASLQQLCVAAARIVVDERCASLEQQVAQMQETLELVQEDVQNTHAYVSYVDEETFGLRSDLKTAIITLHALELRIENRVSELEQKICALQQQLSAKTASPVGQYLMTRS